MRSGQAGYSGTPLAKKLGLKPGLRVCPLGAPRAYVQIVAPWHQDSLCLRAAAAFEALQPWHARKPL